MAVMHQYDYLFAFGTIFAFLDAWNIGANDVANSWANAVASRSITYLQAMCGASVMEFAGAFGVGARVADTIRTKVVDTAQFDDNPALLMLGMVCAVVASSTYLTFATKVGFPVSTTHSIMGGVIGMGVASLGAQGVQWVADGPGTAKISSGVVQVFVAWIIAPALAGIFAALIFTVTKYTVLLRSNPALKGIFAVPAYFAVTGMLVSMLLIWKGGAYEVNLTEQQVPGVIVAAGAAWGLLIALFLCPWLYRVVIKEDWQLKWYDAFRGPLLLRRGEVPPAPADYKGPVRNFYQGRLNREQLAARRAREVAANGDSAVLANVDIEAQHAHDDGNGSPPSDTLSIPPPEEERLPQHKSLVGPRPDAPWYSGKTIWWGLKFLVLRGVDKDVVGSQNEKNVVGGDIEEMHARAQHFDNRAEFLYTFLQVMTSSAASFVHGANDVSNAIGPYATIYQVWQSGAVPPAGEASVPLWILAFGGVAIVIGIWTYGYNIMRNLGNRLTLQSPSRGFSIELGSVVTIIMATRLKLPVSTTQCITGATVGVGLCNGDWRAINWRMVGWIYTGWIITLPVAGIISGGLLGIIINAPRWGVPN
ncbi:phosphate-repressible phosphate permease [Sodiomyces alkalinus F11]|uniref:Phosphate transporter n=1 Tax=Sodiomyces alkalinus (strain CBS 110278 / VKM F-3762 / F11) TaxID=1314773 RepID=A0A3N2PKP4_SODAK|nr:phosphate-repressible phosphate permease [Sodiomyces alkalinus F11]ROT35085.1 phosphate-repressible phosphate permease [Sodiomyces alkalinus F11]